MCRPSLQAARGAGLKAVRDACCRLSLQAQSTGIWDRVLSMGELQSRSCSSPVHGPTLCADSDVNG